MSEREPAQQRADRAPQRIGAVLPTILGEAKQHHGMLWAVQQRWRDLVGNELATHTKPVSLRRGRLTVYADQPGDTFTLAYRRTQLLQRLQRTAKERIDEILIRPGDI